MWETLANLQLCDEIALHRDVTSVGLDHTIGLSPGEVDLSARIAALMEA